MHLTLAKLELANNAIVDVQAVDLELAHALVEIKLRRDSPSWLDALADSLALAPAFVGRHAFSKFVAASRAVHGSP